MEAEAIADLDVYLELLRSWSMASSSERLFCMESAAIFRMIHLLLALL
jgi:hypothetical protein